MAVPNVDLRPRELAIKRYSRWSLEAGVSRILHLIVNVLAHPSQKFCPRLLLSMSLPIDF
jgi:hypothetical protein